MVSIITVNYNGLDDTCEMIDSFLLNETYPFEIIVVDNGSQPSQAEKICGTVNRSLDLDEADPSESGAKYQQWLCRRKQCRTECGQWRLPLFHQQRHLHYPTDTRSIGSSPWRQAEWRSIPYAEIPPMHQHYTICRFHSLVANHPT